MSDIRVTYDGDTYWLECIPGNANSILIRPVEPGDSWEELASEVRDHQAQHGCAQDSGDDDGSGPDSQLHEGDWDDAVSEATS